MSNKLTSFAETKASLLTPRGRGAIATILVSGPAAGPAIDAHFAAVRGTPIDTASAGQIAFGSWSRHGSDSEEVVIACIGEQTCELNCHGGSAAASAILEDLTVLGCQVVPWHEMDSPQKGDAICRAARRALAQAATQKTALVLLAQYHGALSQEVSQIIRQIAHEPTRALKRIDRLLLTTEVGLHLTQPWKVVLTGPPNVGKSSLINAIAGYQRAITCDIPGTTRDVLSVNVALDGWPVTLLDTAGIHATENALEIAGIQRAAQELVGADMVIRVSDADALDSGTPDFDPDTGEDADTDIDDDDLSSQEVSSARRPRLLFVRNKVDLVIGRESLGAGADRFSEQGEPRSDARAVAGEQRAAVPPTEKTQRLAGSLPVTCLTSVVTGEGIDALIDQIVRSLVPAEPMKDAPIVFDMTQRAVLESAVSSLRKQDAERAMLSLQALLHGDGG